MKLDQFLKWQGWVATGGEAKLRIRDGQVQVNGQVEYRRGRQLAAGDQIDLEGETAIVPEEPQAGFKLAAAEQQRSKRAQTGDRATGRCA